MTTARRRALGVLGIALSIASLSICRCLSASAAVTAGLADDFRNSASRIFTVRDSIELPRIQNFAGRSRGTADYIALFSPDRQHFLIQVRRGDVRSNVNIESILLFRTADVEDVLGLRAGSAATPLKLFETDVADDWAAVSAIQWFDNHHVGFVSQGSNAVNQAFIVDIRNGKPRQITHSETDVASFAFVGDDVLYYAYVEPPPNQFVYVRDTSLFDLVSESRRTTYRTLELVQSSLNSGVTRKVSPSNLWLYHQHRRIWMSPSGRWAVVLTPATDVPDHWAEYAVSAYKAESDRKRSDSASKALILSLRYALVDVHQGTVRSLLDAPVGVGVPRDRIPIAVFWSADERSVVISDTFLPLTGVDASERQRRANSISIAEVELDTGGVRRIYSEPIPVMSRGEMFKSSAAQWSIDWARATGILSLVEPENKAHILQFQKRDGNWHASRRAPSSKPALHVRRTESLNERPVVSAIGGACNCTRRIYDPSPYADEFTFGRAEAIEWAAGNITWHGSVTFPPTYDRTRRYPLIVQTHGFEPNVFLIDGPGVITTAMAAQAFANAGFIVLQIEDSPEAMNDERSESSRFVDGYRAAINRLIQQGLVDPQKVGLIAYSRTGLHIVPLLDASPDLLRAVCISDAAWWSYTVDVFLRNDVSVRAEVRRSTLEGPLPGKFGDWFERNPLYRSKSKTAVRLEAISVYKLVSAWEHFAILKDSGRPVDFVYFPQGNHNLYKPLERLESQGGTLDWFRFWLMNQEDTTPEKAEQLSRWRALRSGADRETDRGDHLPSN